MSILTDLRFLDPEGLVNRAAFNERFETLNQLYQYWWRRRMVGGHYRVLIGEVSTASILAMVWADRTAVLQYASDVSLSETGEISLANPIQLTVTPTTWVSKQNILRGKYIVATEKDVSSEGIDLNTVYYISNDAVFRVNDLSENSYYWLYADHSKVTSEYVDETTDWEYVQSTDRNAYVDSGESGGYEYQYLGIPFDNAVTAPKIATGSYTGTGTYGSTNPNTLMADFEIKLAIVTSKSDGTYLAIFVKNTTGNIRAVGNSNVAITPTWNGKTLSWYSSTAQYQINSNNVEYAYILIG